MVKKSGELLWALGIIFVALGVAICSKANLGVSMVAAPAFVIYEFIAPFWSGFSVGMTEYIIQGLMLAVLAALVQRLNWRYLLAFAVAVIYGYTLNLFLFILGDGAVSEVWQRWVLLIVGDAVTAFGVACFFRTYMPLQVYELFVAELAARFKLSINKVKTVFDISLLLISIILAFTLFGDAASFDFASIWYKSFHSIGLGTVITTIINSPLIALFGKLTDKLFNPKPAFPKLKDILERK